MGLSFSACARVSKPHCKRTQSNETQSNETQSRELFNGSNAEPPAFMPVPPPPDLALPPLRALGAFAALTAAALAPFLGEAASASCAFMASAILLWASLACS